MNPYPLCNFLKNRWFLNPAKAQVKVKNVTTDDSVFVVECFPQDCNLGTERPARFGFMGMFTESMQARLVNSCEFDLFQIWIKLSLNKKILLPCFSKLNLSVVNFPFISLVTTHSLLLRLFMLLRCFRVPKVPRGSGDNIWSPVPGVIWKKIFATLEKAEDGTVVLPKQIISWQKLAENGSAVIYDSEAPVTTSAPIIDTEANR